MIEKIKHIAKDSHTEVVEIRRHLHMNPELSYQEKETGIFVAQKLKELGISYTHGVADNGVVALMGKQEAGFPTIALRADMDALPILEANDVPYCSKNKGVMHACGHDVHTASLLGVAKILRQFEQDIKGCIKLIFQPAEEKLPGGAFQMIKEGVLENPAPASIFGQHVHPPLECGKLGFKGGAYMASADEIRLEIIGKGGHGALPQNCIDPVAISAQVLVALQQIVSRLGDPTIPSVLTFGKINSDGGATNIIPDRVMLEGTFRTMNEAWRLKAHSHIEQIIKETCAAFGATYKLDLLKGMPSLYNNEEVTTKAREIAVEFMGVDNVVDLPIRMSAEDFAYYSQEIPACFYRLGTGNKSKGITSPVHTNTFDVDEKSLMHGMGFMSFLALKSLERHN